MTLEKVSLLCKFSFTETCSFARYELPGTWDDVFWLEGFAARSHMNAVLCEALSLIFGWQVVFFFLLHFKNFLA